MSLLRAMVTVGGLTMVSRVAGFARDVLTAAVLGASPMADAFFVALKLPNLSRRLFADGAFTVAFVPLVTTELARHGRPAALAFAGEALAALLTVLVPLTLVALLAMPACCTSSHRASSTTRSAIRWRSTTPASPFPTSC